LLAVHIVHTTALLVATLFIAHRKIGEGGFSRVYEVFGEDKRLKALKVFNFEIKKLSKPNLTN
jgi:serine/threonine protein kinase